MVVENLLEIQEIHEIWAQIPKNIPEIHKICDKIAYFVRNEHKIEQKWENKIEIHDVCTSKIFQI